MVTFFGPMCKDCALSTFSVEDQWKSGKDDHSTGGLLNLNPRLGDCLVVS